MDTLTAPLAAKPTALSRIPLQWLAWFRLGAMAVWLLTVLGLLCFNWSRTAPSVFFMLQMMIPVIAVTWWTRSIRLVTVLECFILGSTLIAVLTPTICIELAGSGVKREPWRTFWVPVFEEVLKFLPLLLVFLWPKSRLRSAPSLTDFLLIALAVGTGFHFSEDLARGWEWKKMAGVHVGPHLGPFYLFPNADLSTRADKTPLPVLFAGHGVLTAWVGIGLALAARAWKSRKLRLAALLSPVVLFVIAVADHAFFNTSTRGEIDGFAGVMQWVIGLRGHFLTCLFPLAVAACVFFDWKSLRRYRAEHPRITPQTVAANFRVPVFVGRWWWRVLAYRETAR